MTPQEWADWNMQQMCECLDAPPPQESATVAEMRTYAREELCEAVKDETVLRWANELEAANKRIAELEGENSHLRECLMKTEEKLAEYAPPFTDEFRQPAPSREVDWEAIGISAFQFDESSRYHNWYELSEKDRLEWKTIAKAVVAAYESQKGAASGD